ncbi:MAG: MFS transporter, partial [Firmicutes bacterium]|nr:MFS transporter [Bacillota bacterium]
GALHSVMIPARQAALRDILAQEELAKSNAFLQQLASVVKIAGPLGGGLLLSHMEPRPAMLINVAACLLGLVALLRLPPFPSREARPSKSRHRAKPYTGSLALLRVIYQSFPAARTLTPVILAVAATMMVFDAASSIIVRDMLQAGEGFLGVLVSLIGLGTLISSTGLALRKYEGNPWHDLIRGEVLLLAIPISVVVVPYVAPGTGRIMVGVLCFIGGLGNGLAIVQTLTLLQLVAPEGAVGRISGIYQGAIAVSQLVAAVLTPFLASSYLSLPAIFGVLTVVMIFLMVRTWLSTRRAVSPWGMAKFGTTD